MQGEEAVQGRIIYGKPAPEPRYNRLAYARNSGEKISNNGCTPERHLPPRKHIAHKGSCHHQQQNHDTQNP